MIYFSRSGNRIQEYKNFCEIIENVKKSFNDDEFHFLYKIFKTAVDFDETFKNQSVVNYTKKYYYLQEITKDRPFNVMLFLKDLVIYYYNHLYVFVNEIENQDVEKYLQSKGHHLSECVEAIIEKA